MKLFKDFTKKLKKKHAKKAPYTPPPAKPKDYILHNPEKDKICKAFFMKDREEQLKHLRNKVIVERYGWECNGNILHTWDDGERVLYRCPECDALILAQFSEYHSFTSDSDGYYTDYYPVASREDAVKINENYNGYELEGSNKIMRIMY